MKFMNMPSREASEIAEYEEHENKFSISQRRVLWIISSAVFSTAVFNHNDYAKGINNFPTTVDAMITPLVNSQRPTLP